MKQPNKPRPFTIAFVRWPNGLASQATIKTVTVIARTKAEAKRKAKQEHTS